MTRRYAMIKEQLCAGCGSCCKVCPKGAVTVPKGVFAVVDRQRCIGCGLCQKACPASVIEMMRVEMKGDEQDATSKEMV